MFNATRVCIIVLMITLSHGFSNNARKSSRYQRLFGSQAISMPLTPSAELQSKINLYNTATRTKELFEALSPPKVSFYSCGPTVYDYAHIGNFRAFLTYDILKRWLEYCGYHVDHVCNLTDIDDKIIVKMTSECKSLQEVTDKYSQAFFEDLDVLNIRRANSYPKATNYIKEMEEMIDQLVSTNHAYTQRGSVYYRVSAFKSYGEFAGMKFDDIVQGAGGSGPNLRRGQDDKESAQDFALWKSYTPQDLDVYWDSKFGKGRPGWHIECSAMCCKLLGKTIDIHAGGSDLVFPHHQNEIAQSEAYTGQKYSRYWIHNGFVNVENVKMSKSLKNFKTLRDIAASPIEARAFRFLVVTSQYRNPLNFSPDTLKAAINSLRRIDKIVSKLEDISSLSPAYQSIRDENDIIDAATSSLREFEDAMCDDMNTPKAASHLFAIVSLAEKAVKSNQLTPVMAKSILSIINQINEIFGVLYTVPPTFFTSNSTALTNSLVNDTEDKLLTIDALPDKVVELANRRVQLKLLKQFDEADKLRQELSNIGFVIKDKKDGFDIYQRS